MYQTILLAVALQHWERYSAHALAARAVAASLAREAARHLHVVSVYDYQTGAGAGLSGEMGARLREAQVRQTDQLMADKLDQYVAPLEADGLQVTRILRVGNPRELIVQIAAGLRADCLVIGSHSKRGLLDIVLGGTAQAVSRHAPCTVVLVSPAPPG